MAKQKDKNGKITIAFRVPRPLHRALRMIAAREDASIESVANRALNTEIIRAQIEDGLAEVGARREARRA